jgi:choline dehydrogenase-like flavoprotein
LILKHKSIAAGAVVDADICIIGAGAAGITLAIELGRNGIDTLVIPGGGLRYNSRYQGLYKGTSSDGTPLERSRHRRFGGTTAVWGGRCIPFDQIDFEKRSYVEHSGWPISLGDLTDYYRRSQEYLDLGTNLSYDVAEVVPDGPNHLIEDFDDDVLLTDRVEKFSLPTNLGKKYYREIAASPTIRTIMDSHMTRLRSADASEEITTISCVTKTGTPFSCKARIFVLATGGLETTRHLLQAGVTDSEGVGNRSGLLGRFFMTHLSGVIAEVAITPGRAVVNRYETDEDGVYCRRRLQLSGPAQEQAGILNFSSFLHHPPIQDAEHRNPLLSLLFLAKGFRAVAFRIPAEYSAGLAYGRFGPRDYLAHLRNVVIGIPQLLFHAPELVYKRLMRRRKLPSIIINNKDNRFCLHYHVEHAPHLESRVTLADQLDEHGLRRLHVSMQYKDIDVQSILTAHNIIKERLERSGVGTLTFLTDDPFEHIKKQIAFGGHQIGTTRMALDEEDGVVDVNCRVFGVNNLYVAGPSIFPTAGQANPVLTIVALAIRLADHLRVTVKKERDGVSPGS